MEENDSYRGKEGLWLTLKTLKIYNLDNPFTAR